MTEMSLIDTNNEFAVALAKLLDALDRMHVPKGQVFFSVNVQQARAEARLLVPAKLERRAKKDRAQQ